MIDSDQVTSDRPPSFEYVDRTKSVIRIDRLLASRPYGKMCKQCLGQFSLIQYEYMPRNVWSFCVMRKLVFLLFLFQKPENRFLNTGEGREQKKLEVVSNSSKVFFF